jgi:hypothetical protein
MKTWKLSMMVMAVMMVVTWAPIIFGAVSAEEAAKLGKTLTHVGAEMDGNKEGTIPPYTGGLTKAPANYKPGSGVRPDPFAAEKPLFSINAQNMSQYADRLTDGTKAMMKKYPTFRIDIYKTQRTVAYPDVVIRNTAKNAQRAKTYNGGLSISGARAGVPFPIPKDGYEVMWNHLTSFRGRAICFRIHVFVADNSGRLILMSAYDAYEEFPYYDEDETRYDANVYFKTKWVTFAPERRVDESGIVIDKINMYEEPRIAYQYLPGQRRLKLAPEFSFDCPSFSNAGTGIMDEFYGFHGSMERYNMKLIGKKEIYIPYNTYRFSYAPKREEVCGPRHLNPDYVRWELHRVWVVEGTLKSGQRHIYPKRLFYTDEDSWNVSVGEDYDAKGYLVKVNFPMQAPSYDVPASNPSCMVGYNLNKGMYHLDMWPGEDGYVRNIEPRPQREWAPQTLVGRGIR